MFCLPLCLYTMTYLGPLKIRRGVILPGTGATDSGELPCECRELNLDHLQEHQVLLTAEPWLQPCKSVFIFPLETHVTTIRISYI